MNTLIGTNAQGVPFHLSDMDKGQHIDISGSTGTGKSVLLQNLIAGDAQSDNGFCVIDPHGSLAETVLTLIPPYRHRQVVFLNMADLDRPVGLPFISDIPPDKRFKVAEDVVATFVHIWGREAVGDRSQMVLRNALRAVMDDGGTLLSIPKLLKNKRFRSKVLQSLQDEFVEFNWREIFEDYSKGKEEDVISPILNKLDAILVPPLRNILGQPQATIDVRRIMDEERILIVSLQKGRIGELPARFLGALIVAHIANQAFSRADMPGEARKPFFLYADEFHNFVSSDFETILSETRKYGLFFRLANQYAQQLDHRLHEGILTNCDTKIVFRCSPTNARELAPVFGLHDPILVNDHPGSPFCEDGIHEARVLTEIPSRHAWIRTTKDGQVHRPLLLRMAPPPMPINHKVAELIADSRTRFGRARSEVELRITKFLRSYPKVKRRNHPDTRWEP